MTTIGIISDAHGLLRPEAVERLKACDAILHAEDVNKPEILDALSKSHFSITKIVVMRLPAISHIIVESCEPKHKP